MAAGKVTPAGKASFTLDNRTGYSTDDLKRFFARGLVACGAKGSRKIIVVAAHARSRGCAEIGFRGRRDEGEAMVMAIAAPAKFTMKRFSRVFEHEVEHTKGKDHEQMEERILWSLGDTPAWARDLQIRYRRRAPSQIG